MNNKDNPSQKRAINWNRGFYRIWLSIVFCWMVLSVLLNLDEILDGRFGNLITGIVSGIIFAIASYIFGCGIKWIFSGFAGDDLGDKKAAVVGTGSSLAFQVGYLCEYIASNNLSDTQREVLLSNINSTLKEYLEEPVTQKNSGSSKISITRAVKQKYHSTPDKYGAFIRALQIQMGNDYPLSHMPQISESIYLKDIFIASLKILPALVAYSIFGFIIWQIITYFEHSTPELIASDITVGAMKTVLWIVGLIISACLSVYIFALLQNPTNKEKVILAIVLVILFTVAVFVGVVMGITYIDQILSFLENNLGFTILPEYLSGS